MTAILPMSVESNLAVVRRAYAAFGRGDVAGVLDCFAPDACFDCMGAPHLPCAGLWRGHEGLGRFLAAIGAMAEVRAFEPGPLLPLSGGRVMVEGTETLHFRGSGREATGRWLHVFVLGGGLIQSGTEWNESAVLAAAFRGG